MLSVSRKQDFKKEGPDYTGPSDGMRRVAYSNGTISNATMLMILMSGLIAGPAVSL